MVSKEPQGVIPMFLIIGSNLLISKSFWKSRNLFSKRFLAAGGIKSIVL